MPRAMPASCELGERGQALGEDNGGKGNANSSAMAIVAGLPSLKRRIYLNPLCAWLVSP